MCVSCPLSVTPLHCVAEVRVTPENINFCLRVCPPSVVNGINHDATGTLPTVSGEQTNVWGNSNVNKPQVIGIMRGEGRGRLLKKAVQQGRSE